MLVAWKPRSEEEVSRAHSPDSFPLRVVTCAVFGGWVMLLLETLVGTDNDDDEKDEEKDDLLNGW